MSWLIKKRTWIAIGVLGAAILVADGLASRPEAELQAQGSGKKGKKGGPKAGDSDGRDADREVIKKAAQSFVAAFERGDAKAVAAHFTEPGEYLTDDGTVIRGRAAIEKEYRDAFTKKKKLPKVEIELDSIRFPSKDTAIEEGYFKVRHGKDGTSSSKYSVLHVREGDQWLMAIVREWPSDGASLRDLEWLIGAWTAKREDIEINTKYAWWGEKGFIRVDLHIKTKERTIKGFQMIGKDAATGQLRSWTFDPEGSFAEATWSRDAKKWVQDAAAVLADGTVLTATNIIVPLDQDSFTFQSVQRTIGDEAAPDIGPIRVTRVKAKE